ncbi:TIGR03557 family F420-dependent LLM class oxidoreductase [Micromonosporaceae bacterium B7E4]
MVGVGYTLMCEQTGPKELVDQAVRAEQAGFDYLVISDHYYPWLASQGHSPYAWAVLGAVAHATSRVRLMTYITCPIRRYHPAVVAQKAATIGVMSDGRFTLSLGAGENLNEHVAGAWPYVHQRHEMLEEALQIIRPLLDGDNLSYSGNHFEVPEAYLWDRPATPVPIALAASGPHSVELASEYADALVCDNPDAAVVRMYDERGGAGKPRYGQAAVCYGPDADDCRKTVHDQWRWAALNWTVKAELPGPESFVSASEAIRPEDIAELVPCGPELDSHVEAFRKYVDAGFTDVAFVQVGVDSQPMFLDWAERELLPRLREL